MEPLAQFLWLLHKNWRAQIAGIDGALHDPSSHAVSFGVSRWRPQQLWGVEAFVLPKITAPLPGFPVPFKPWWKHLTRLCLNDRDFSVPGPVDVLLGANIFCHILLYGRWNGPSGTPLALETHFRWVVSGKTCHEYPRQPVVSCFSTISAIQKYLDYAERVCTKNLQTNSRLERCGNHLEASMIEMHNRHLRPCQAPQLLASL